MKYTLIASNYTNPPTFVLNSKIDADSPYHAGLLFGKEMHSAKTKAEFSVVITDTDDKQYEVHLKKRKTKGGWFFFGQTHQRRTKGKFSAPNPIPTPIPMNAVSKNVPTNNKESNAPVAMTNNIPPTVNNGNKRSNAPVATTNNRSNNVSTNGSLVNGKNNQPTNKRNGQGTQ